MSHRFEDAASNELSPAEIRQVLEELHSRVGLNDRVEEARTADATIIADISEATGFPLQMVCDAVEAVKRGDREAEISRVLRELEEPLYRVERPGHSTPDPLSRHFPWAQKKLTSSILDDQKRMDAPRKLIIEKKEQPHEKALNWLAVAIFVLITGVVLFAVLASVLTK